VVQQRGAASFRFSAFEEKVLWGDLADVFHLVYTFSAPDDPIRKALGARHFDAVILGERQDGFYQRRVSFVDARDLAGEVFEDGAVPRSHQRNSNGDSAVAFSE
jgi:hypothetical protein